jgi:glycerol-3-phosphate dehydrogenase (NAD(P)+)
VLSDKITSTNDIKSIDNADIIINAVPTKFIRSLYHEMKVDFSKKIIINASKGIEQSTSFRISQIFNDACGVDFHNYVALTGPSHAEEVVRDVPTTVIAASIDHDKALYVQELLSTPTFRIYTSDDLIGAEIGGAIKNVIAIAAGIIDGLGMGDNTKAALITRGLAEMSRIGDEMGADIRTFSGLSGLGDLFVTCNSKHSRNRSVGERIGKGEKYSDIANTMKMVAEGVFTTRAVVELCEKLEVEMPIAEQINKILFDEKCPKEAIRDLMQREYKKEWW